MSTPKISVLLPVYNGGELLRDSVQSILDQTWADFELLAIDDGSTDETPEILRSFRDPRLRVLRNEPNRGLTASLNRGMAEAKGEWIARQDADDLSARDRFARQIQFLTAHPGCVLVGTSGWRMNPSGRITGSNDLPCSTAAIRWASLSDNPFLHTSVMFHRETALALGGYDARFSICQDFDLWNRLAERHPVANLRERLVSMREHPSSMTRTQAGGTTDEASTILQENVNRVLPGLVLAADELQALCSFRRRFAASELPAIRAVFARLLSEFYRRNPEAASDAELHAMLARQSLRTVYKLMSAAPLAAFGEGLNALRWSPAETIRQAVTMLTARLR